jgi:LPXTG-motif cell wall-anchored protein
MYNDPLIAPLSLGGIAGVGGVGGIGDIGGLGDVLPMTGQSGNPIWFLLTAFALIALGMAILRTIPRREA